MPLLFVACLEILLARFQKNKNFFLKGSLENSAWNNWEKGFNFLCKVGLSLENDRVMWYNPIL